MSISIHALAKRATSSHILSKSTSGISIHALAKRATRVQDRNYQIFYISIHALAKRATLCSAVMLMISSYFNPRPRKEGDYSIQYLCKSLLQISIHALAKRATANLYNDYLYFEAKYHISDIFPL